jgi:hypothetical protein
MILYEVMFRGPSEQTTTVQIAANDEVEASLRVRNGIWLVDCIDGLRHMGYVSVPAWARAVQGTAGGTVVRK